MRIEEDRSSYNFLLFGFYGYGISFIRKGISSYYVVLFKEFLF